MGIRTVGATDQQEKIIELLETLIEYVKTEKQD